MSEQQTTRHDSLRVVHLFRAPVGGLFRHVCDLVRGQAELGLQLGMICDATTGDEHAASTLAELSKVCTLGVHRVPMGRSLGWSDAGSVARLVRICAGVRPEILHGHGAKGGAYARLAAGRLGARSVYTPHGGSLHFSASSPAGFLYLTLERFLRRRTNGLIFESQFAADTYARKVGTVSCACQVIHNGVSSEDFASIPPALPAYDFVFVGELRRLKGLEVLLEAIRKLSSRRAATLFVVGAGPDSAFFERRMTEPGLDGQVTLSSPIFPATRAFAHGRCVVIPSLAESFPYVVLEAAAAKIPLLATRVGGIPEIFGPYAESLLPPGDPDALATAMENVLAAPAKAIEFAHLLKNRVKAYFTTQRMVDATTHFYQRALMTPPAPNHKLPPC